MKRAVLLGAASVLSVGFVAEGQVMERINVSSSEAQANGDSHVAGGQRVVSADGRYVVFESTATNLVSDDFNDSRDIFLRDRQAGITTRVSVSMTGGDGWGESRDPSIPYMGRYVCFLSDAPNLVGDDTNGVGDIFGRDRLLGVTTRLNVNMAGGECDDYSSDPMITQDGRFVVFESSATNLVPADTNGRRDVFLSWGPAALFVDGFEDGSAARWSAANP